MAPARRAYRRTRELVNDRRRALPAVGGAQVSAPAVFILTPDFARPAGGIRAIYRHIDILNDCGIPAAVLHQRPGFRCSWFDNQTTVRDVRSSTLGRDDLLVVTELDVDIAGRLPEGTRHAILNQSGHLTWQRGGDAISAHYLSRSDLVGVAAVSAHSVALLRTAFPALAVERVRHSISPQLFHPGRTKRREITYLTRRGAADADIVLQILRNRGVVDGWDVVPLTGLSQHGLAERLQQSMVFLSFSYQEGFGLPAAEAMACGNVVVGFHGFGGQEFMRPELCEPVPPGDVLAMTTAVERVLAREAQQPGWCTERGRAAASFIHETYSAEAERDDVVRVYGGWLA